jgi:hypothetical protein
MGKSFTRFPKLWPKTKRERRPSSKLTRNGEVPPFRSPLLYGSELPLFRAQGLSCRSEKVTHNPDLLQLVLSGSTVTPTQTNEIKLTQIRSHAGSQWASFDAFAASTALEQEGI